MGQAVNTTSETTWKISFDQAGLDDIKLEDSLQKNAPLFKMPPEVFA